MVIRSHTFSNHSLLVSQIGPLDADIHGKSRVGTQWRHPSSKFCGESPRSLMLANMGSRACVPTLLHKSNCAARFKNPQTLSRNMGEANHRAIHAPMTRRGESGPRAAERGTFASDPFWMTYYSVFRSPSST